MKSDNLSISPIGGEFDLIDHDGRKISRSTYSGKYIILFFGFTNCRVVCPRALSRISMALDLLGDLAEKIQPLYVSVDPDRDTPQVMKTFLSGRYPRFIGLTGDRAQVDAMKRHFRVYAEKAAAPDEPGGYVIPHTALTYMLDTDGNYLAHFPDAIDANVLADRIRQEILSY